MTYDVLVYDDNWELKTIVDNYESLVWTDKAKECGDFELYMYYDPDLWKLITLGTFLRIQDSDHTMMVSKRDLKDTYEDAPRMIFTGKSMEYIISRRVVYKQIDVTGAPGEIINKLLDENCIDSPYLQQFAPDPTNPNKKYRGITGLYRDESNWRQELGVNQISQQYLGQNIYEAVSELVKTYSSPTCYIFVHHTEDNKWRWRLGTGVDRSWNQGTNDWVTFSSDFNNLKASEFVQDNDKYANAFYITGADPGDGKPRMTMPIERSMDDTPHGGFISGMKRVEKWIDGSNVKLKDDNNHDIPMQTYLNELRAYGYSSMREYVTETSFTGDVDPNVQWAYMKDYYIGDIVNVIDDMGNGAICAIDGMTITADKNGIVIMPDFKAVRAITG
jgi:hypothetical protein